MSYEPGTYVKDGSEREAKNAKQAVALQFAGWKRKAEEPVVETVVEPEPEPKVVEKPQAPLDVAPRPVAPKPTAPKTDKD